MEKQFPFIAFKSNTLTVAAGSTSGQVNIDGKFIVGIYPLAQDQQISTITHNSPIVTITLAAAATADNKFVVVSVE